MANHVWCQHGSCLSNFTWLRCRDTTHRAGAGAAWLLECRHAQEHRSEYKRRVTIDDSTHPRTANYPCEQRTRRRNEVSCQAASCTVPLWAVVKPWSRRQQPR